MSLDFSKKSLVVVTGASKGIGKTIAIEMSRNLQNSVFVLLARSKQGLEECKSSILELDKTQTVLTFEIDFYKPSLDRFKEIFDQVLATVDAAGIEFGIVFHNAGHVGTMKKTTDLTDLKVWQEYFNLNLFSVTLLNSAFIEKFRSIAPQLYIVNITSLCGRIPFENLAMYGSGKAARELFFKVLAIEEPNILVLNYSPGPVDTEMFESVMNEAQSQTLRNSFKETKNSAILTTEQTVERLMGILQKGNYKSGDTIDYFDRNEEGFNVNLGSKPN